MSASLALQMRPHACQAGQHVVIAGKLHLHFSVGCLCPLGEYFQNQGSTVDDGAAFDYFLDIALLHRGQFVIENAVFNVVFFAVRCYFFEFSASDVGRIHRAFETLYEFPVARCPCSLCEELQFVQVFINFGLIIAMLDEANKYCFFYLLVQIT